MSTGCCSEIGVSEENQGCLLPLPDDDYIVYVIHTSHACLFGRAQRRCWRQSWHASATNGFGTIIYHNRQPLEHRDQIPVEG